MRKVQYANGILPMLCKVCSWAMSYIMQKATFCTLKVAFYALNVVFYMTIYIVLSPKKLCFSMADA